MTVRFRICTRCGKPQYRVYPNDRAVWSCQCPAAGIEDTLPLSVFHLGPAEFDRLE